MSWTETYLVYGPALFSDVPCPFVGCHYNRSFLDKQTAITVKKHDYTLSGGFTENISATSVG